MSIEEKYKKINVDIQQQIRLEMENIKKGISKKNFEQLNVILEELEKTLHKQVDRKKIQGDKECGNFEKTSGNHSREGNCVGNTG